MKWKVNKNPYNIRTVVECVPHTKTVGITCNVIKFNLNNDVFIY